MQLQIGNKIVTVEDKNGGLAISGVWTEEIKHEDGSQDVIVHVPCMSINVISDRKEVK